MKELDHIFTSLIETVSAAVFAEAGVEGQPPDSSDFFAASNVREQLHNEQVQTESPSIPYVMTAATSLVGEVAIEGKNVLLAAMEKLRDPLVEPYVNDDFFNTDPVLDASGRELRTPNVFSSRFGQLITSHVRYVTGKLDAVPLFLFFFSDGAQKTRKQSMHPCFMSIGNFPPHVRDSFLCKIFLTFFAILKGSLRCSLFPRLSV